MTGSPQSKGGKGRAEKLSPEKRQEIASAAAKARWADGKARASRNADKGGKRPALRAKLAHLREQIRELVADQREGW